MEEEDDPIAEKAFETLMTLKPQVGSNIPYCLKDSSNRYCYACGYRTKDLSEFITHRLKFHDDEDTTLCCFCSMKFSNAFSRHMHQMVIIYNQKCENCLESLSPIHVCSPASLEGVNEAWLAYHCKLGCDTRMKFATKEEVLEHFASLHGVDAKDVLVDEEKCETKILVQKGMMECPECGILINSDLISIAHHIIHECFARGRVQSVFIRYINDLAESQRMDPELILRYELISQLMSDEDAATKREFKTLYDLDIVTLFLNWSEALNEMLSPFSEGHIEFIVQIYSKNLMDPQSDAQFRRNPVPMSYNIRTPPRETTITRLKEEINEFNKENNVPPSSYIPNKSTLIKVAEELGKIE